MCSTLILTSIHGQESDSERLWMSVEKTLASNSGGYLVAENGAIRNNTYPSPTDIREAERRFAAMVLHGLFEGKQTYHEKDRLKMIRWAASHLVSLSPTSLQTFDDIQHEASVSGEELSALCSGVMRHTLLGEGLTLMIKERTGLGHTSWADLLTVFETQHGDVPGAISVRGSASAKNFGGEYNFVVTGSHLYYVRFEFRDGVTVTLTGKVLLEDRNEPMKGHVLEGRKISSRHFSTALERWAARLMYLMQHNRTMDTAKEYVNGRKELLDSATKQVLLASWGVVGETVFVAHSSNVM